MTAKEYKEYQRKNKKRIEELNAEAISRRDALIQQLQSEKENEEQEVEEAFAMVDRNNEINSEFVERKEKEEKERRAAKREENKRIKEEKEKERLKREAMSAEELRALNKEHREKILKGIYALGVITPLEHSIKKGGRDDRKIGKSNTRMR